MGLPIYNSPTEGHDVVVPVDAIIGGSAGAGVGWRMLMESLAAGRGISLPATASAGAKFVVRVASAHATVRKQFGLSIGKFKGVEEPLARMGGFIYLMEAARRYTCGALDAGMKPAVATAIAKSNFTELYRQVINDGMDILGGVAIMRGPRNLLAHSYIWTPIVITAEGANILTRTLMVFGQGAIRCHPYMYREIQALKTGDVEAFDREFFPHIGHVVRNLFRSILLSISRGYLARSPVNGPAARYYRRLAWASASFALLADIAMGTLGGFFRGPIALWSRINPIGKMPSDKLGGQIARAVQTPGSQRDRLTAGIYIPSKTDEALGRLEHAFELSYKAEAVDGKIKNAIQERKLPKDRPERLVAEALEIGVISGEEAQLMSEAEAARNDAIQVDSFTPEEYMSETPTTPRKMELGEI